MQAKFYYIWYKKRVKKAKKNNKRGKYQSGSWLCGTCHIRYVKRDMTPICYECHNGLDCIIEKDIDKLLGV